MGDRMMDQGLILSNEGIAPVCYSEGADLK